jgi:hypothetical protein
MQMDKSECDDKKIRCKSLIIDGTKYRTLLTKKYEKKSLVQTGEKQGNIFYTGYYSHNLCQGRSMCNEGRRSADPGGNENAKPDKKPS